MLNQSVNSQLGLDIIIVVKPDLCSVYTCNGPHPLLPLLDHPYLRHHKSPTAVSDMHHFTCGISSLLHSVNLILFTLLSSGSPRLTHSTSLQSPPSLSPSRPFTPDLKLICFTNPFLYSLSFPFGLLSQILDSDRTKWAPHWRLFVFSSFFLHIFLLLVMCARLSWPHSAFQSTLNSIVSCSLAYLSGSFCDVNTVDSRETWPLSHIKLQLLLALGNMRDINMFAYLSQDKPTSWNWRCLETGSTASGNVSATPRRSPVLSSRRREPSPPVTPSAGHRLVWCITQASRHCGL